MFGTALRCTRGEYLVQPRAIVASCSFSFLPRFELSSILRDALIGVLRVAPGVNALRLLCHDAPERYMC